MPKKLKWHDDGSYEIVNESESAVVFLLIVAAFLVLSFIVSSFKPPKGKP